MQSKYFTNITMCNDKYFVIIMKHYFKLILYSFYNCKILFLHLVNSDEVNINLMYNNLL